MNIFKIFREYLTTGDSQLLDIFEDNGEEKPEPVTLWWHYIRYGDLCKEHINALKEIGYCGTKHFSTNVELLNYVKGFIDSQLFSGNVEGNDYYFIIGKTKEELNKKLDELFE